MSPASEQLTEFERKSRLVLEESVLRIDGRVRSRLNQARHAAIEAAATRRRSVFWRFSTLVPTAGAAAAALLVAMILWHRGPEVEMPTVEGAHPSAEDMDLLADKDGLDLVSDGDGSGSFYEWAAEQSEGNGGETDT
ncbi:MAG TPA: hypothetical protein VHB68_20905 [Steroidobacteraceae bacterium]|nr:hypothetical protein [Steroidobacteraceae bacterium]